MKDLDEEVSSLNFGSCGRVRKSWGCGSSRPALCVGNSQSEVMWDYRFCGSSFVCYLFYGWDKVFFLYDDTE